jgi:hypothetical protein
MNRFDDSKHVNDTDESNADTRDADVLGLGGSVVPKAPGDPSASSDPESVRRRRARAMGSDEDSGSRHEGDRQGSGATGVDMGAGGQGTDLSGK